MTDNKGVKNENVDSIGRQRLMKAVALCAAGLYLADNIRREDQSKRAEDNGDDCPCGHGKSHHWEHITPDMRSLSSATGCTSCECKAYRESQS